MPKSFDFSKWTKKLWAPLCMVPVFHLWQVLLRRVILSISVMAAWRTSKKLHKACKWPRTHLTWCPKGFPFISETFIFLFVFKFFMSFWKIWKTSCSSEVFSNKLFWNIWNKHMLREQGAYTGLLSSSIYDLYNKKSFVEKYKNFMDLWPKRWFRLQGVYLWCRLSCRAVSSGPVI